MIVLGINLSPHDRSVALVKDGQVICAIEEERITREKHGISYDKRFYNLEEDGDYFDNNFLNVSSKWLEKKVHLMMDYIEQATGYCLEDIDLIVCSNLYPNQAFRDKAIFINHHLAHAANAFFLSGFKESAILIADGSGSFSDGEFETVTLYKADGKKITPLQKYSGIIPDYLGQKNNSILGLSNSLGVLYKNISALVGCGNMGEGKMMGLASYGKPKYLSLFEEFISIDKQELHIDNQSIYLKIKNHIEALNNFGFQERADLAYSCQEIFNNLVSMLSVHLYDLYHSDNLCVAGGCFLNAITNSLLLHESKYKNIFVPSSPGDNGTAVGAALYGYYCSDGEIVEPNNLVYFGRNYSQSETTKILNKFSDRINFELSPDIYNTAANLLVQDKVGAWFQDGSEFGPRALGNRSIIANPHRAQTKDYINQKIKFREDYRPLAPVILEEYFQKYFIAAPSKSFELMTLVADATELAHTDIPATIHVDGTARVQQVSQKSNLKFYRLIKAFYTITGIPAIVNTSFNLKDEPIVETPEDAINSFLRSSLDFLIIDNFLIGKKSK